MHIDTIFTRIFTRTFLHIYTCVAMNKALALMKAKNMDIPFEFWNNLAVLQQRNGLYKDAEENYMHALSLKNGTLEEFSSEHVTVVCNMARLFTDMKRLEEARQLYQRIIRIHPSYTEGMQ